MKNIFLIVFIILDVSAYTQTDKEKYTQFNKDYKLIDINYLLNLEDNYAKKINKNPEIHSFHVRLDRYRFRSVFLGLTRNTDDSTLAIIKSALKSNVEDPSILDTLYRCQVLMKIGNKKFWMPIQNDLLPVFNRDVSSKKEVMIYCDYINDPSQKYHLQHIFLIFEFLK